MKISINEPDGLTQRLEMLSMAQSADFANTSISVVREPLKPTSSPATKSPKQSPIALEMQQERQRKIKQTTQNVIALKAGRANRLAYLLEEEKARAEAEAQARLRKQQEEERLARERAEQRAKEEKERQEAAEKAEKERLALEKEERDRQAAAKAAAEREAAEKAKKEKEAADKLAADKAEKEAARKAAEAKAKEEAEAKARAAAQQGASTQAAANEYAEHMKVIEYAKATINPQVSANKDLKKACFDLKIKIKSKLGQLTPSRSHLHEIHKAIGEQLTQAQNLGELGYDWVLNQFSKMVVQQAACEAGVNTGSAVPLAMVCVLTWTRHARLGQYLIARFVKKNPYLIGYQCAIDTEQGRKRMGYRRDDSSGQWEAETQYAERIGGYTAVWGVMTQAKMPASGGNVHPYPITHSWIFMARQLNLDPQTLYNGNFAAVSTWWEVVGSRLLDAYGQQANKLLHLACNQWVEAVADKKFPAAKRLALLGQDWAKEGKIEPSWKPLGP